MHVTLVGLWVALGATLGLIGVLAWAAATDLRRFAVFGISGYLVILLAALEVIPAGFQSLVVEPNELEFETPFVRHNIALTRAAYGLDKIDVRFHTAKRSSTRCRSRRTNRRSITSASGTIAR